MTTIKIDIPAGFEIDSFDKSSGTIKFKETPKKAIDRIKTVADILKANGLDQDEFDDQCDGIDEDEVAYRLLKMLAKALNEGWTPDWDNSNEYKYVPWFYMQNGSSGFRFDDCGYWSTYSAVGSRLCFKTRELAEYAGKQFESTYKKFMIID